MDAFEKISNLLQREFLSPRRIAPRRYDPVYYNHKVEDINGRLTLWVCSNGKGETVFFVIALKKEPIQLAQMELNIESWKNNQAIDAIILASHMPSEKTFTFDIYRNRDLSQVDYFDKADIRYCGLPNGKVAISIKNGDGTSYTELETIIESRLIDFISNFDFESIVNLDFLKPLTVRQRLSEFVAAKLVSPRIESKQSLAIDPIITEKIQCVSSNVILRVVNSQHLFTVRFGMRGALDLGEISNFESWTNNPKIEREILIDVPASGCLTIETFYYDVSTASTKFDLIYIEESDGRVQISQSHDGESFETIGYTTIHNVMNAIFQFDFESIFDCSFLEKDGNDKQKTFSITNPNA